MIRAAGLLIVADTGRALLLQRSSEGDCAGMWCIPGGKVEDGESVLDAAVREVREEIGREVTPGDLIEWSRRQADGVDFTTYMLKGVEEFNPVLNNEHVAYVWAEPAQPPMPLHPGCVVTLAKCMPDWTELHVAHAISTGEMTSPQKYENIWMFDIRITGTGQAFRHEKRNAAGRVIQEAEHVWRDPSIYLNEEFIARCNGLPAILEHPNKEMLDGDEFKERVVGTVMLPYQKGEEIWGIARIYDEPTAQMMSDEQLSTSPAVVWSDPDVNVSGRLHDGSRFLIEGKPSLLDHIAICRQGVWDKGGDPSGIITVRGDSEMTEAEMKDIKARLDASEAEKKQTESLLGSLSDVVKGALARMDGIEQAQALRAKREAKQRVRTFRFSSRKDADTEEAFMEKLDAEEEELAEEMVEAGDPVEVAADKAKKRRDAAEAEEMKADTDEDEEVKKDADEDDDKPAFLKADSFDLQAAIARGDAVDPAAFEEVVARLDSVTRAAKPLSDEELNAVGSAFARADSIFSALGQSTPRHQPGQSLLTYRRDLAARLKPFTAYKDAELSLIAADEATFKVVEDGIYREAHAHAMSPAVVRPGELRMKTSRLDSGHTVNEFYGDPSSWMNGMAGHVKQSVKLFRTPESRH